MHPESDCACMMVQWTVCAPSPRAPAQMTCNSCVSTLTQYWAWPASAWSHSKMVKGFWSTQSRGRKQSCLHKAYCVVSLAATLECLLPGNSSVYRWSLLGEDFEFKSDKLKLSLKRKVICCDQMRWQTLAFQKSSIKWKINLLLVRKFTPDAKNLHPCIDSGHTQ